MAEGFARVYGSDVLRPLSAGLAPAAIIQDLTRKVMAEKNISLDSQSAKDLASIDLKQVDVIINMSGRYIPQTGSTEVREWKVDDPIGKSEEVYVRVRDEIEHLVMRLILELRKANKPTTPAQRPRRLLKDKSAG